MKEKLQADLTVITLLSVACVALCGETLLEHWELWMIPVLLMGLIGVWGLHILQYGSNRLRVVCYLAYGLMQAFFHGVHATSFFDVAVVSNLLFITFSVLEIVAVLNAILVEYIVVMLMQMVIVMATQSVTFDSLNLSRLALHITSVIVTYNVCRIVIHLRRFQQELIHHKDDILDESDRDMEDFLTNISHELRTPVNVVNGMSTLILQREDNAEVEAIKLAGIRLSNQIEDIQDYTEIDRGEVILEKEQYMITSLVNDVIASIHLQKDQALPEIIVDIDPKIPIYLYGDYKKLRKILRHLLDNAIKFTRFGGIYIRVVAIARDYGVNLSIEIRDTGMGMSKRDMARVTKGLFQANKRRDRSTGGIGLGLNIVYGFVHEMGGFVKIESKPGMGSRVRISVPQDVVDPTPCLSVNKDQLGCAIYYFDSAKYEVAQVRDFYRYMAVNLAKGLECRLYAAANSREIEQIREEIEITHIFAGYEEYMLDKCYFDDLARQNIVIAVSTSKDMNPVADARIVPMPKPFYGATVCNILNEGVAIKDYDGEKTDDKFLFEGVKALIVDDEPMNLVVATGIFRDYGMATDTAGSGLEAMQKYGMGDYNVIFMDHMMPEMDGVETMKRIRKMAVEIGKEPLIVALTANAVSGAKEMFLKEGFDGFIAKPIDISDFERVMKRILPENMIRYIGGDRS